MKNFYTQTFECPSGFNQYLIHQSVQTETVYREECRRCDMYSRKCCKDIPDGVGRREINLFVCNSKMMLRDSLTGLLSVSNRYVYGGSYTSVRVNPITGIHKCPNDQFKTVQVTSDLIVCLADQVFETRNLPHYGGMFSCSQGNVILPSATKQCLDGYSSYVMGAIENDCPLYVCLKFDKLPDMQKLPAIILPPFYPISTKNQTKVAINPTNTINSYSETSTPFTRKSDHTTLGLSIAGLVIALITTIAFIIFRIRRRTRYNSL